jgi:multicomponent Na+:H+ antiporter subunit C
MEEFIHSRFNYWIYVILMMIGLWGMISKNNLIKKLIGMSIFQTAIILFYVSIAVKSETSNIPILPHHGHDFSPTVALAHADSRDHEEDHGYHNGHHTYVETPKIPDPDGYANPLPHVLMLTAIVVGVATLGLALAITQKIYREYGTLEEDELLEKVRADDHD